MTMGTYQQVKDALKEMGITDYNVIDHPAAGGHVCPWLVPQGRCLVHAAVAQIYEKRNRRQDDYER